MATRFRGRLSDTPARTDSDTDSDPDPEVSSLATENSALMRAAYASV